MSLSFLHYISPKYLSKNACNFVIMPSFLAVRLPPPKRETGGRMRSTSVPVVFNTPSRKELSTNLRVSSGLSFSSAISVSRSIFLFSDKLYPVVIYLGSHHDVCRLHHSHHNKLYNFSAEQCCPLHYLQIVLSYLGPSIANASYFRKVYDLKSTTLLFNLFIILHAVAGTVNIFGEKSRIAQSISIKSSNFYINIRLVSAFLTVFSVKISVNTAKTEGEHTYAKKR